MWGACPSYLQLNLQFILYIAEFHASFAMDILRRRFILCTACLTKSPVFHQCPMGRLDSLAQTWAITIKYFRLSGFFSFSNWALQGQKMEVLPQQRVHSLWSQRTRCSHRDLTNHIRWLCNTKYVYKLKFFPTLRTSNFTKEEGWFSSVQLPSWRWNTFPQTTLIQFSSIYIL